ncbi:MAG: hypothetical protein WCG66_12275 [bacterium]
MILALVGIAWLVATNHCAIATMAGRHSAGHSCCKKEVPASGSKSCAEKCCGELASPVPEALLAGFPVFSFFVTLPPSVFSAPRVVMGLHSTGLAPPGGAISFYVRFLAGSTCQSTAPPLFWI